MFSNLIRLTGATSEYNNHTKTQLIYDDEVYDMVIDTYQLIGSYFEPITAGYKTDMDGWIPHLFYKGDGMFDIIFFTRVTGSTIYVTFSGDFAKVYSEFTDGELIHYDEFGWYLDTKFNGIYIPDVTFEDADSLTSFAESIGETVSIYEDDENKCIVSDIRGKGHTMVYVSQFV